MIAEGDSAARNAFREGLRTGRDGGETPLPLSPTQHVDVLEIPDVATAIARVEPVVPVDAGRIPLPVVTRADAYGPSTGHVAIFAPTPAFPEPTSSIRTRKRGLSWFLVAALASVALLAAIAILAPQETATAAVSTATLATTAAPSRPRADAGDPKGPGPEGAPTGAAKGPRPIATAANPAPEPYGSVPVVDVNSLPTAGSGGKSRAAR